MLNDGAEQKHDESYQRKCKIRVNSNVCIQHISQIHTDHQHFAVAEIDDFHNTEDDVLTHAHQGIEAAKQNSVYDSL